MFSSWVKKVIGRALTDSPSPLQPATNTPHLTHTLSKWSGVSKVSLGDVLSHTTMEKDERMHEHDHKVGVLYLRPPLITINPRIYEKGETQSNSKARIPVCKHTKTRILIL